MKIVFVGTGELINRLPETFNRPGLEIIVLGPATCSLRRSKYITKFIELPATDPLELWHETALANYKKILEQQADWVIFSDDETVGAIAKSAIPAEEKLKLLPVKSDAGLEILGSKVGLANSMNRLAIPGPKSAVACNRDELDQNAISAGTEFLIKGDLFGGGSRVRKFDSENAKPDLQIPLDWYPVVVQEFIEGDEVSVEALFRDGQLTAWMYSVVSQNISQFGPSVVRRYFTPANTDFETTLNHIGNAAQLHGFFNCALIWSPDRQAHFLFELDPRPNAWHQFGKHFGIDWVELMLGERPNKTPVSPKLDSAAPLHLYSRDLRSALASASWRRIKPWLTNAPGTWQTRNHLDSAVNRFEARSIIYWFAGPVVAFSANVWQSFPMPLQKFLVKTRLKQMVIFLIGA